MNLYRVAREQYAHDLSGKGGLISSARWHDHMPVIYTSVNSSTAILEKLVQLNTAEIHHDLMIISIVTPDKFSSEELSISQLPDDWNRFPAPSILKMIGNAWLSERSSLLLFIPSVVDPMAKNALINPLHPEAEHLKIGDIQPFTFDERIRKGFGR